MSVGAVTSHDWKVPLAIGLGLAALAGRQPSWGAAVVTAVVGLIGIIVPLTPGRRETSIQRVGAGPWWTPLLLGVAAVAVAASLPEAFSAQAGPFPILPGVAAAVAEEAFFRRLMYGWLARWGDALAIWVTAAAFALVHVPAYGPQVLPIDFAAGLLFGWQRWATGGWSVPALTHVTANLLV